MIFAGLVGLALLCAVKAERTPGGDIQLAPASTLLKNGVYGSKLFSLQNEGSMYADPVYVLELHGTAYQQGYDAGLLFGREFAVNYDNLMTGTIFSKCVAIIDTTSLTKRIG